MRGCRNTAIKKPIIKGIINSNTPTVKPLFATNQPKSILNKIAGISQRLSILLLFAIKISSLFMWIDTYYLKYFNRFFSDF